MNIINFNDSQFFGKVIRRLRDLVAKKHRYEMNREEW